MNSSNVSAVRTRPPMASKRLDLQNQCDICQRSRGKGSHQRCSKIRQSQKNAEWAAYMANQAAAKQLKAQKERRHV